VPTFEDQSPAVPPPVTATAPVESGLVANPDDQQTQSLPVVVEPVAPVRPPVPPVAGRRILAPRIVALRPELTSAGYRSVHADLTRTSLRSIARGVARSLAETMITVGVIAVLFAGYEIWGTATVVHGHQADLERQLTQEWGGDPTVGPSPGGPSQAAKILAPPPGNALARLYIPRLGNHWVVVEGVQPDDLRLGPGHYPATAKPGQIGNFAVAGHRTPAMFWDLDQLHKGDPIIVETANTWFVYGVTEVKVTSPTAVEVVAPVPGKPGARPTRAMLTITTCNPKWANNERLIVHAAMTRQLARTAGRPTELG
jgi:sortase A